MPFDAEDRPPSTRAAPIPHKSRQGAALLTPSFDTEQP
jgi:hypothetical protein